MKLSTALKLGRTSNIPTVWSNCLAGAMLTAASASSLPGFSFLWLACAISLMYLAGMFLNDAYDAKWDVEHGANRPIAMGEVSETEVWRYGWSMLIAGPALLILLGLYQPERAFTASLSSIGLAVAIVAYDAWHKKVSYGPWLMGACRFFVYLTAGLAFGQLKLELILAGGALMAYIVGLTYIARTEHLNQFGAWWPLALFLAPVILAIYFALSEPLTLIFLAILIAWLAYLVRYLLPGKSRKIPKAIGGLLAGIPLIDATVLAGTGHWEFACLAILAFVTTILLHRKIAGT